MDRKRLQACMPIGCTHAEPARRLTIWLGEPSQRNGAKKQPKCSARVTSGGMAGMPSTVRASRVHFFSLSLSAEFLDGMAQRRSLRYGAMPSVPVVRGVVRWRDGRAPCRTADGQ